MPIRAKFYDPRFKNTIAVMETDNRVCMVDRQGKPTNSQLLNSSEIHTTFRFMPINDQVSNQVETGTTLSCSILEIGPDNLPAMLIPKLRLADQRGTDTEKRGPRNLRVLIGGLGLGGVPEQLLRLYDNLDITTVELNQAVVKCYHWFCKNYQFARDIRPSSRQTIIVQDFFDYVANLDLVSDPYCSSGCYYDMVFFDAYLGSDGDSTNQRVADPAFIRSLLKLKTQILVFNQFMGDPKKDRKFWTEMLQALRKSYDVYEVKFSDQSGIVCVSRKYGSNLGITDSYSLWPSNSVYVHSNLRRLIKSFSPQAVKRI